MDVSLAANPVVRKVSKFNHAPRSKEAKWFHAGRVHDRHHRCIGEQQAHGYSGKGDMLRLG